MSGGGSRHEGAGDDDGEFTAPALDASPDRRRQVSGTVPDARGAGDVGCNFVEPVQAT